MYKKKVLTPAQRRQLAEGLLEGYRVSERRACSVVMLSRTVFHYIEHKRDDRAIRQRIREIAETRVRYGFDRVQVLLRREGWTDNHRRTYRIYKEEGLNPRSKRPRRSKAAAHRSERPVLAGPHGCWSMDFVADQLLDGRRFRALTLVDNFSRECLEIEVGQSLKGFDVVDVMERIKQARGIVPKRIQVIMEANSSRRSSTGGHTKTTLRSTSQGPENRRITRSLSHSTGVFETSV